MELLILGMAVVFLTIMSSVLWFSFSDRDPSVAKKRQHYKSHKKIMTQDGMFAKKTAITEPLFLFGDSKVIR